MQDPQRQHAYQDYSYTTQFSQREALHEEQQPPPFQQAPDGQRLYHQPYMYAPPFAMMGDGRLSALLSYSLGWVSGLLFLLFAGHHPYVRFHALQSLVFFGLVNLLDIGGIVILRDPWFSQIFSEFRIIPITFILGLMLLNFIAFAAWIVGMIQAGRGLYYRLPIVGDLVANASNPNGVVK